MRSDLIPGVSRIFALALVLGAAAALHATAVSRDLNSDGPLYLLAAVSRNGLALFEPARRTVQLLQQSFSWLGFRAGVTDLVTMGRLLTLGMQGWPIVLTGLCWFLLPRAQKGWILGPLLNVAAVIPTVSPRGIHEVIIASCLMWVLFLLLEFGPSGWLRPAAAALLTAACFDLNETAFPFMTGIALLAGRRALESRGLRRAFLLLIVPLALAAAGHAVAWTVHPRDPLNRGDFLRGALGGFLVTIRPQSRGLNLLVIAGVALGICLLLPHLPRRWRAEHRGRVLDAAVRVSFVFFAIVAVSFVAVPGWVTLWDAYSSCRWLPPVATTIMALATHWLRRARWDPELLAPAAVRAALVGILAMHLVVQTSLSSRWSAYQRDLAALVAGRRGPVDWATAARILNPRHDFLRGELVWGYAIQPLSIALAPGGRVQAAVDARPGVPWKPYRLEDRSTLPLRARGLDWSPYLEAIGRRDGAARDGAP